MFVWNHFRKTAGSWSEINQEYVWIFNIFHYYFFIAQVIYLFNNKQSNYVTNKKTSSSYLRVKITDDLANSVQVYFVSELNERVRMIYLLEDCLKEKISLNVCVIISVNHFTSRLELRISGYKNQAKAVGVNFLNKRKFWHHAVLYEM